MVIPPGVQAFPKSLRGPPTVRKEPGERRAAPTEPLSRAQAEQEKRLDELIARLKGAADGPETEAVAALARVAFARAPSETQAFLTQRALTAEAAGAPQVAATLLDRVIAVDRDWAEAFVQRARLRLGLDDPLGAKADLNAALRIEPRRFDALAALAALLEAQGDKKGALATYRRALKLAPKQENWRQNEERLRTEVEGRDI
jgi:Tfp pilus assembly protein PilF